MYRCKICGKKYTELAALYNHIESKHRDMIPKDMTVQQYYYYMKTGKMNGNCVMCKKPTSWNHNTGKYNRFCGDEKCKEEYVKIMKSRMVAKYGKTHLLNDPNKQREMLANRSISGVYKWSDGKHETTYTGSYELDFLKTLDGFFDWDPTDISMPSPHTYTYKYEGEDKFYIPDVFIHSLDLEIEIKDGGDNPNNHYKIQAVDKHKEALKDEVMCSQKAFHYIKITNKNYENFFSFLKEIKKEFEKHGDDKKIPRIFKTEDIRTKSVVQESYDLLEESTKFNKNRIWISTDWHFYKNKDNKQFKVNKNIKEILNNYKKCVKPNDTFIFLGDLYDARTIFDMELVPEIFKIKDLKGYKIMIKGNHDVNTTNFYLNLGFDEVYDSTYNIGNVIFSHEPVAVRDDEINIHGHIHFSNTYWNVSEINHLDAYIEHYNFKPVLLTDLINEYRNTGRITDIAIMNFDNYLSESTEIIEEGNELIDDIQKGLAKFDKFTKVKYSERDMFFSLRYDLAKNNPKEMQEYLSKLINAAQFEDDLHYVRKMARKADDHYRLKLKKNPDLKDEYEKYYNWFKNGGMDKDIKEKSKKVIKESTEEIQESYITDTMEESSISIPQMSYYLQNQYEEDMKDYLNTYKKYYNLMLKEQPAAVKHINEDIRKCLIVIDGLADKGVENNLVQFAKDDLGEIVKAAKKGKPVKVIENTEYVEEGRINDNIDKFLMWLEKPKEKYKGVNITLYHASVDIDKVYGKNKSINTWNVGDVIEPASLSIAPGATLYSNPRNAIYFWDNIEHAYEWGLYRALDNMLDECEYLTRHGKCILVGKNEGMSDDAAVKTMMNFIKTDKLCKKLGLSYFYIYETEVSIHDLEITGIKSLHEYTVSKPVTILKKQKIEITEDLIRKHCIFAEIGKQYNQVRDRELEKIYFNRVRNPILSPILKDDKDYFRGKLASYLDDNFDDPKKELKDNRNKYRHKLNTSMFKIDYFGIDTEFESTGLVEDMVNIDDSTNDINSITVQDDNVSISNVVECKLVYNNPNSKQLFSLTDVKSQLIIENSYVVQRDKVGTHCSVSPVYTDLEEENVLEFQLVLNEGVDIHTLNSKLSEGVVIASLYKFDDDNFRFIKESCLKLFGVYPKEIKIK